MQKLENTDAQLKQRLKELREAIRQKRNNIADLEAVLHEDARRMKQIPMYFWVLLLAHFLFMLEGWRGLRGVQFFINFVMFLWMYRKVYREIAMHLAVPTSLLMLVLTFAL
jgi:hypothetical protein